MGCKVGGFSDEQNSVSAELSDALLLIFMYMIGLPVDVHVKDGSVYTGIFYTASAHQNYEIVLKKAVMTKKGNREVNIELGSLVDTLVVGGEDIVQIVAKGVPIPENGILVGESTSGKHNHFSVDKQLAQVTRLAGDGLDVKQSDDERKTEYQGPENVDPRHFSSSDKAKYKVMSAEVPSHAPIPASARLDDQSFEEHASEKSPLFNEIIGPSTDSTSIRHLDQSISNSYAKDSRLNPEARVFAPSPSAYQPALVIPAIPAEVPIIGYFLYPSLMATADAAQLEYDGAIQSAYNFARHAGSQMQAVTFANPYQFDAASAYVHQNSQTILAGQMGLPVYLPPLAHDAITASGLSQLSPPPMLAHYQVQLPEQQDYFNQPHQT